jgi:hypothetical protein
MNFPGNKFQGCGVSRFMKGCAPGIRLRGRRGQWFAGATVLLFLASATAHSASGQTQVTTSQYDNARTGANLNETLLTPQNVNVKQFGRLAWFPVDGDVYAQPLYLPAVEIPGKGKHNLVLVVTEHDSVYAFDADKGSVTPLWEVSFVNEKRGIRTVFSQEVACPFIEPEIGITSTPVVDLSTGTVYVLARTKERNGNQWEYRQKLHALAITNGAEKFGGPVSIHASTKETNYLVFQGKIDFDPLRENQRAALLLSKGKVYIAWASSCDVGPYYGWVMAYDAKTLAQEGVVNLSSGAKESGIWQADAGPAADSAGNVYLITGNGKFTASSGGHDYGDSVVKLGFTAKGLEVRDYFTPSNQEKLNETDGDFGSGAPLLLPDQPGPHSHLLLAAGKAGFVYEIDRDKMGKFRKEDDSHAAQVVTVQKTSMGAPAYWNGHVYYALQEDAIRDYKLQNGRLSEQPVVKGAVQINDPGSPAVSANGAKNGIVWVLSTKTWDGPDEKAVLYAFEGENLAHKLYSSSENYARDHAGRALRFTIPTIANGKVYVGAKREVDVYGLLAPEERKK